MSDLILRIPVRPSTQQIEKLEVFREAVQVLVHLTSAQFTSEELLEACETAVLVPVPAGWLSPSVS